VAYDNNGEPAMDADSLRIVEEALRRYGLSTRPNVASDVLTGAGQVAGSVADTMASNRGAQIDAAMLQEHLNQARQAQTLNSRTAKSRDDRESGANAFREMQRAEYLANATGYTPKNGLPSYGFGPKAATETEKRSTRAYAEEVMRRLEGGSSIPEIQDPGAFQFDPKLLSPGMLEKLASMGVLGSSVADAVPSSSWAKVGKGAAKIGNKFLDFIF
jgi:hypothetical protein